MSVLSTALPSLKYTFMLLTKFHIYNQKVSQQQANKYTRTLLKNKLRHDLFQQKIEGGAKVSY